MARLRSASRGLLGCLALCWVGVSVTGCASAPVRTPPAAPDLDQPAWAIPADLDLVVRVDLRRLRAVIGNDLLSALEQRLRARSSEAEEEKEAATGRWLLSLLAQADTAWIAVRPGLAAEHTDSVIVLRGRFTESKEHTLRPPWGSARDLGATVLRFERPATGLRSDPVLAVVRAPDRVIVASAAEVDAVDRVLDGRGAPPLRAPDEGLISLSARLDSLTERLKDRAPSAARLLVGATRAEAKLDRGAERYQLKLDLTFETPEQAAQFARAAQRVQAALAAPDRRWVERIGIQPVESYVSLGLELSEQDLLRAVACLVGGPCVG